MQSTARDAQERGDSSSRACRGGDGAGRRTARVRTDDLGSAALVRTSRDDLSAPYGDTPNSDQRQQRGRSARNRRFMGAAAKRGDATGADLRVPQRQAGG